MNVDELEKKAFAINIEILKLNDYIEKASDAILKLSAEKDKIDSALAEAYPDNVIRVDFVNKKVIKDSFISEET